MSKRYRNSICILLEYVLLGDEVQTKDVIDNKLAMERQLASRPNCERTRGPAEQKSIWRTSFYQGNGKFVFVVDV